MQVHARDAEHICALMTEKSNRDMEAMLGLFAPLLGVSVSYKTIERLYGDEAVRLVLCNALALQLREQGCSGELAGDGTGYSLAVKHHYASDPGKRNRAYRYLLPAIGRRIGPLRGIRLLFKVGDGRVQEGHGKGAWHRYEVDPSRQVLQRPERALGVRWILADPYDHLREYYKRNLCETMHACDKGRFGRTIRQRREDLQERAMVGIAILHNVFTTRVPG